MKFIKKNIKLIIGIILGILLVSGISVYATYSYFATDVKYTRNGREISVEQALNELYHMKQETSDKKYTETEYQNYGELQYNKAMLDHNYYVNDTFSIEVGNNYYNLGFTPSVVFVDCGGGLYAWIINGDDTKHWADSSNGGNDADGTRIVENGFYWNSNTLNVVKLYVIK